MNLNPEQERAVQTTDGPVLIVAGAGSGKTRVIAHRILNLVQKGVAPHSILAITFTNKAASEMRERVIRLLSEDNGLNRPISINERPFVSTFHALGVHMIRENARLLGLNRHFNIYDRSDSRRAIKEAMLQAGIDPKKYEPGVFLNKISRAKSDGANPLGFKDSAKDFMEEMTADVWEKYGSILTKDGALDFDDLLVKTASLLKDADIRKHYNSIWRYIHVDEYQDTNRIQYQIANHLAGTDRNICVVGDADQNIYSWRGATIENILHFEKDYPEATVITLETNYRSTKNILAAANSVIEKNSMRKKKTLRTDNPSGEKIALLPSYNENDEARAIADISRGLIESGTPAKEIAVLYRANFQSRALEEAFIKKNIPYQLIGVKFFERKEVKDVLSYIRAALNSNVVIPAKAGIQSQTIEIKNGNTLDSRMRGNDIAIIQSFNFQSPNDPNFTGTGFADIARIINVPPRGIGKVTIAKVLAGSESSLPDGMRAKIADFRHILSDIRKEILEKKPSESVKFVIQETGMERVLREGDSEDEERLLNIHELVTVAAQYDHLKPDEGIEAFLSNAALATDQDELKEESDAVKLMTVHASKGLEFDNVFIAGLEQDLFPFKHMDEDGQSQAEDEEERRLFYVALTRARKKVHLSHTLIRTVYGTERINTVSEFIDDIDSGLIEENIPPEKPTGAKAIFIDF